MPATITHPRRLRAATGDVKGACTDERGITRDLPPFGPANVYGPAISDIMQPRLLLRIGTSLLYGRRVGTQHRRSEALWPSSASTALFADAHHFARMSAVIGIAAASSARCATSAMRDQRVPIG